MNNSFISFNENENVIQHIKLQKKKKINFLLMEKKFFFSV